MAEKDSTNIISSNVYSQMGKALREMQTHYVQSTQAYVEELGNYTLEIKKLTTQIEALKIEEQKNITLLRPIEDEIYYCLRELDKLNEMFAQHILHKKELLHLLDEIEEYETTVLEQELQRLNILSLLEPIQHQIVQLKIQRKESIDKKEQYETTKISQIALFRIPSEDEKEVVDIDIIEGDIDKNMADQRESKLANMT